MDAVEVTEENSACGEEFRSFVEHQLELIFTGGNEEEFVKSLTKIKDVNVNWVKMFNIFKDELSKALPEEWNEMWKDECLNEKLTILNDLKKKYKNETKPAWRPEAGNIEPQIVNLDVQYLSQLNDSLTNLVIQVEEKLRKQKDELTVEWDHLKNCHENIREARNVNSNLCTSIDNKLQENVDAFSRVYDWYVE